MSDPAMWELTADNAVEYLRQNGWLTAEPARAEALSGGVSNVVLRVEQGARRMVVKQSRPRLRTREEWLSDVDRVHREQAVMELLGPLLPPGAVPAVLFADRERFVLGMEHAPSSTSWKQVLLGGEVDAAAGEAAGALLGTIHQATAERAADLDHLADRKVFVQLRVDPFYRRIAERCPDVSAQVAPLIDGLMSSREALCHGDFSPKNLMVAGGAARVGVPALALVDHETGHLGEPAMDVGFFFSHLLLKSLHAPARRAEYDALVRSAWRGYASRVSYTSPAAVLARGVGHLGVCLLARIDGTSPVDYLTDPAARDAARRLGRWLLRERPASWEDILTRLAGEAA